MAHELLDSPVHVQNVVNGPLSVIFQHLFHHLCNLLRKNLDIIYIVI